MKRRALCLVLLVIVAGALFSGRQTAHAGVEDFSFKSFEADYYLSRDEQNVSQLKVVEKLTAVFPSYDQNRGLRRAIPKEYKGRDNNVEVVSVTDGEGRPRDYKTASQNDNLIISIRSDSYVYGEQEYVITYMLRDVISFEANQDEWYWDVNGDQWPQEFQSVIARAHVPAALATKLLPQQKCFTGAYGSSSSDCVIARAQEAAETVLTVTTTRPLLARETLTFVTAFEKGTFSPYKIPLQTIVLFVIAGFIIVVLPPLVAFVVMLRLWRKKGRDPRSKNTVIAQYTPSKGMNPLLASLVLQEKLQPKAISATMLDLCIRGYLKLYEVKKDKLIGSSTHYEVELVHDDVAQLAEEESVVIGLLFPSRTVGTKVDLSSLANTLHAGVERLDKQLATTATTKGYFVDDPHAVRKRYVKRGMWFIIPALVLLVIPFTFFFTIGLVIAGIIVVAFGSAMPARTPDGVVERDHLKGMELYMKMAEVDRIKMLQSPQGAEKTSVDPTNKKQLVKLYEELLPYAVLFGLEKQWAKEFAELYEQPPGWYGSSSAFNAVAFSHALGGFNSAAAASFSSPSSSGSSGFGGGGFSGGGGGGGGGGGL